MQREHRNRLEFGRVDRRLYRYQEFNYLVVKAMHALGVVHLENQARV